MMARWWTVVAVAVLIAHSGARDAAACSCRPNGPPCQAAWDADAIFAGTARSIEVSQDEVGGGIRVRQAVVHFEIDRPFLKAAAGPVEIVTEDLSTCDYRFIEGQKYVVYARKRDDGRWTTSVCSRTRPLREAAEDLKFLAAIPKSGTGARVSGRVTEWVHHPADEHGVDHGPLESVTVNVRGATFSREVLTDRNGGYELTGIPVGAVSITVVTPFGFRAYGGGDVEVKDLRACVAEDFAIHAESAAHGIVVDQDGRPLRGVSVEAVAEELAGYQPNGIHNPAISDDQGRFSFDRLPPGAYVFGINITKRWHKPPTGRGIFLPGTAAAKEATVFTLKPGDKIDVGTIRLANR